MIRLLIFIKNRKIFIPLVDNPQIRTAYQIHNTSIYLHKQLIQKLSSTSETYVLPEDIAISVYEFIHKWESNEAFWFRGIPGCHWSWDCIRNSTKMPHPLIKSEGEDIEPNYTMGNEIKTRWLPGEVSYDMSFFASLQCLYYMDPPEDLRRQLPISTIVKVRLGRRVNARPICFMPGSEVQLMGPLPYREWTAFHLIWCNFETGLYSITECQPQNLPPKRPYIPLNVSNDGEQMQLLLTQRGLWHQDVRHWRTRHFYQPISLSSDTTKDLPIDKK